MARAGPVGKAVAQKRLGEQAEEISPRPLTLHGSHQVAHSAGCDRTFPRVLGTFRIARRADWLLLRSRRSNLQSAGREPRPRAVKLLLGICTGSRGARVLISGSGPRTENHGVRDFATPDLRPTLEGAQKPIAIGPRIFDLQSSKQLAASSPRLRSEPCVQTSPPFHAMRRPAKNSSIGSASVETEVDTKGRSAMSTSCCWRPRRPTVPGTG
jgi:hypothetical protein